MRKTLFILALSALASGASAQMGLDPQFSFYNRNTLNVNPALAGQSDAKWQVQNFFREQAYVISQPFTSGGMNLDINLPINAWSGNIWGVGLSFIGDEQGDTRLRNFYGSATIAVGQYLDPREEHSISIGIQAGMAQRYNRYTDIYWDNQWAGDRFNLRRPTGENLQFLGDLQRYFDLSTGVQYSYDGDLMDMTAGYAAYHANSPDASLYIDTSLYSLPTRHTVHWRMEHRLRKDNMMALVPSFMATRQGKTNNIIFGNHFKFYFNEATRVTGKRKLYSMSLGVHHRLLKDVIGSIMFDLAGWSFGAAYDVSVGSINKFNGYQGAWEVMLGYRAGFRKGSNAKYMPHRKGKL